MITEATCTTEGLETKVCITCEETVETVLRNHVWVEYIEHREKEGKIPVKLLAAQVQEFIEQHPTLRYVPTGEFYQHEHRCIGADFPFKELTLQELGIPDWDVLHVKTATEEFYVELAPHAIGMK